MAKFKLRLSGAVFTIIFTALLGVILSSCKEPSDIGLKYQSYPIEASGILTYDGRDYGVSITAKANKDYSLSITSSGELCGMTFSFTDGKVFISDGIVSGELNDGGYSLQHGILLSREMFFLQPNFMSGAEAIHENGVKYSSCTYSTDSGKVTVYSQVGAEAPDFIKATLNGHEFRFVFVNEQ